MSKFIFFFFAAVCLLQAHSAHSGRLIREADESETESNQLQVLSEKATTFLTNLGDQFGALIGAKDAKQVEEIVRSNTEQFISSVTNLTKQLQSQLSSSSGEVQTAITSAITNLNSTIINLQNENPEVTAKAREVQAKLQEGFQSVLKQADELNKQISENTKDAREDFVKLTKKTYDAVLENAQKVQKEIHDAANKA